MFLAELEVRRIGKYNYRFIVRIRTRPQPLTKIFCSRSQKIITIHH
nr:MAG TPA: hypothetical protein [Caudoviricetes sp.]